MACVRFDRFTHVPQIIVVNVLMFMMITLGTANAEVKDPRGWGPIKFGDSRMNIRHVMDMDGYQAVIANSMENYVRSAYGKVSLLRRDIDNELYQYLEDAKDGFVTDCFWKKINNDLTIQVDVDFYGDKAHAIRVIYRTYDDELIKKTILDDLHSKYGNATHYITVEKPHNWYEYQWVILLPKQLEFLMPRVAPDIPSPNGHDLSTPLSSIELYRRNHDRYSSHKHPVWCVGSTLICNIINEDDYYYEVLSFEDIDFIKRMMDPINKFLDKANNYYSGGGKEKETIKGIQDSLK